MYPKFKVFDRVFVVYKRVDHDKNKAISEIVRAQIERVEWIAFRANKTCVQYRTDYTLSFLTGSKKGPSEVTYSEPEVFETAEALGRYIEG